MNDERPTPPRTSVTVAAAELAQIRASGKQMPRFVEVEGRVYDVTDDQDRAAVFRLLAPALAKEQARRAIRMEQRRSTNAQAQNIGPSRRSTTLTDIAAKQRNAERKRQRAARRRQRKKA
jgi:hypothetical protein